MSTTVDVKALDDGVMLVATDTETRARVQMAFDIEQAQLLAEKILDAAGAGDRLRPALRWWQRL